MANNLKLSRHSELAFHKYEGYSIVNSGELLKKQAMRKQILLYTEKYVHT
jgi:hypothetical protein